MTVRCVVCNRVHEFRNHRGSKLSERKCECGGALQMLGGTHSLSGKHPFDESKTHVSKWWEGEYFYADKNKRGEYFVIHDGYFHQIVNPIFPKKPESVGGN